MVFYSGYESLIESVYENKQEHVFSSWDKLDDTEKKSLLDELGDIDFELLKMLYAGDKAEEDGDYSEAPYIPVPDSEGSRKEFHSARAAGIDYIRQGKLAAFVVAGGQGSRLGYEGPKGKYPVGSVSGKTLFRIHGEKIVKYSQKYDTSIPWLIMTSSVNHEETLKYFEENNNFGISKNDIFIFPQNMIPSLSSEGKLIMESSHSIFKNPDGHGGSLTALMTSGVLDELKNRGIETISYFQVDNPLVKIVDPEFTGFHIMNDADISSKTVKKAYPDEKMGVFVKYDNGKTGVVEYSDLPEEKMMLKDRNGELVFSSGSIAIHLFQRKFIEGITSGKGKRLPFHTARKKIKAFVNNSYEEIDGFKFEKFVFDSLKLTGENIIFETVREEEFAPVKNASGVDSVESAKKLMNNLFRNWIQQKGINIPGENVDIEVSPLFAVEPDDISSSLVIPGGEKVYLE